MERFASFKTMIRSGKNAYVIQCTDILYGRANGSYAYLYTVHGEQHVLSKNLKQTSIHLNCPFMFRVSQSILLNLLYVKKILFVEKEIELVNGERIPYTIRYKELTDSISALYGNE